MRRVRWKRSDYALPATKLARALLGQTLVRVLESGDRVAGRIVETEAYLGTRDEASHAYGGRRSPRNESMYARPGTAYVYFTYGMHFCMNIAGAEEGVPEAVLIRALEPVEGIDELRRARAANRRSPAGLKDTLLCSGPARLCQAMAIDRAIDGEDLTRSARLFLERPVGVGGTEGWRRPGERVRRGPRIGIGSAGNWVDRPLRWFLSGNAHVSR